MNWGPWKRESHRRKMDPSLPSRLSTSPLMTSPTAPAATFSHLDATTVLSREIVELGIYPAVDPLASTSRILDPLIIGEEHYKVARGVQEILQRYKELQDIIAILGMEELGEAIRLSFLGPARSSAS